GQNFHQAGSRALGRGDSRREDQPGLAQRGIVARRRILYNQALYNRKPALVIVNNNRKQWLEPPAAGETAAGCTPMLQRVPAAHGRMRGVSPSCTQPGRFVSRLSSQK